MRFIIVGILFWANSQWAGVAILKPYRSWWVNYSYGQTFDQNGRWINMWCKPTFGHTDVKRLAKLSETK